MSSGFEDLVISDDEYQKTEEIIFSDPKLYQGKPTNEYLRKHYDDMTKTYNQYKAIAKFNDDDYHICKWDEQMTTSSIPASAVRLFLKKGYSHNQIMNVLRTNQEQIVNIYTQTPANEPKLVQTPDRKPKLVSSRPRTANLPQFDSAVKQNNPKHGINNNIDLRYKCNDFEKYRHQLTQLTNENPVLKLSDGHNSLYWDANTINALFLKDECTFIKLQNYYWIELMSNSDVIHLDKTVWPSETDIITFCSEHQIAWDDAISIWNRKSNGTAKTPFITTEIAMMA